MNRTSTGGVSQCLRAELPGCSCNEIEGRVGKLRLLSFRTMSAGRFSAPAFWRMQLNRSIPPSFAKTLKTSRMRLLIAEWLNAVIPTRLPARISVRMRLAPVKVLPVPGGPWTAM